MVILLSSVHGAQELEGRVIRHIVAVQKGGSDICALWCASFCVLHHKYGYDRLTGCRYMIPVSHGLDAKPEHLATNVITEGTISTATGTASPSIQDRCALGHESL